EVNNRIAARGPSFAIPIRPGRSFRKLFRRRQDPRHAALRGKPKGRRARGPARNPAASPNDALLAPHRRGRVFFDHCVRALSELEEAERALSGMRGTPRGLLRVTVPLSFAFLGPIVGEFVRKYPEVRVELFCTDRIVDLVAEGFDAAI